jgi:hypothetical protein
MKVSKFTSKKMSNPEWAVEAIADRLETIFPGSGKDALRAEAEELCGIFLSDDCTTEDVNSILQKLPMGACACSPPQETSEDNENN